MARKARKKGHKGLPANRGRRMAADFVWARGRGRMATLDLESDEFSSVAVTDADDKTLLGAVGTLLGARRPVVLYTDECITWRRIAGRLLLQDVHPRVASDSGQAMLQMARACAEHDLAGLLDQDIESAAAKGGEG